MCKEFESLMQSEFEMSMMGELTFFLGVQVKLNDASPMRTPMATNLKMHKDLSGPIVECKL